MICSSGYFMEPPTKPVDCSLCRPQCFQQTYETMISTAKSPGEHGWRATISYFHNVKHKNVSFLNNWAAVEALSDAEVEEVKTRVSKNNLKLMVYFSEQSVTHITESPAMTFPELLSNIGGALGLYLGASLVVFCEQIELFYRLILAAMGFRTIPKSN